LAEGSNNYDETNDFFRMKLNGLRRTFRHGFCRTLSAEVNEIGNAKTRAETDRVDAHFLQICHAYSMKEP
jgi:hypothetical protein